MASARKIKTTPKTAAQAKADKYITPEGKKPRARKAAAAPQKQPASGFELFAAAVPKPESAVPPAKLGRPTLYSQDMADYIIESLTEGKSLLAICAEDGMPNRTTVLNWCATKPDFAERVAKAREDQADLMDDLIYETANKSTSVTAAADRVKLQAYSWRAEHLKPRKYGRHVNMEQTALIATGNINILDQLDETQRAQLREIIASARSKLQTAETEARTRQPKQIEGKARRA